MEQQDVTYDASEYIETVSEATEHPLLWFPLLSLEPQASGNKVSRTCVLCGSKNIVLNGKVQYLRHFSPHAHLISLALDRRSVCLHYTRRLG